MKIPFGRFLALILILLSSPSAFAGGPAFSVLYTFCPDGGNCTDGSQSVAGLIRDSAGNLYGTTEFGGANGSGNVGGTVFRLTPLGDTWTETVLYSFCSMTYCADGNQPAAGLIRDASGNLYGTTQQGGSHQGTSAGYGTVFKLAPPAELGGAWTETVIYTFCSSGGFCPDGVRPVAGLMQDSAGNLYGTTFEGGANASGTVFKLAPPSKPSGLWTHTVLYSFCSATNCVDGIEPEARVIQDAAGNLYGTAIDGGAHNGGTVFALVPPTKAGDPWTETVLYNFCSDGGVACTDGGSPFAGLVQDAAGNLYGTTQVGGAIGGGTVFELAPPAKPGGPWTHSLLYSFCSLANCTDGSSPYAGLIYVAGGLYGTTNSGGVGLGNGTVFKLAPQPSGLWTYTVLYSFCPGTGICPDGSEPFGSLINDATGNLYSTTTYGGLYSEGTVFELTGGAQKANDALGEQADYFGEGTADFTVWRPSTATFYSLDSSNRELSKHWGVSTDIPVIGDFDGDGKTDFAVFRPSTGTWYIIQSSNGKEVVRAWGAAGDIPVPGDYDGDGKTDLAVFRPSNGTWYISLSSNLQEIIRPWGATGDIPVPGDYNGDGKTDFAIFRPSTGKWYILISSTLQEIIRAWGEKGDIPVPGDYDGDGKTDFAIWRPSSGTWYILLISNLQEIIHAWGTEGDIPVARDYDGDGKADFAVWRPSDRTWYVTRSSNGTTFGKAWGASGDIPMNKPVGQ
jgi:uncharacterized repeat protein (TIGR03803 family)